MARKYICDNCGKEYPSLYDSNLKPFGGATLFSIIIIPTQQMGATNISVAEICPDCREKLLKIIEEGWQ
jgi:protein-arginine kinase activator protein McsA